ncbi:MAG: hypothetical protein IPP32_05670 [Bacteroidetes bacterium]|nr:hypothetical protein [Bacteroidota bacterium]
MLTLKSGNTRASGTVIEFSINKTYSMKNQIQKIGSISILLLMLFIASCTTNDSDLPSPTDARDKYIGTWSCAENSSKSGASTFDVVLRKNVNDDNQILIDNFYLLGSTHYAVVTKSGNSLTLSTQSISGNTVQGSGSIAGDTKINLSYSVNDGSGAAADNCTAILTKR